MYVHLVLILYSLVMPIDRLVTLLMSLKKLIQTGAVLSMKALFVLYQKLS